jgi:hypothetical protein
MYIYIAASRGRRLAIGFRGLGNRVCFACLGAVSGRFRARRVQRRPEPVSICRICLNSGYCLESVDFDCNQARMREWSTFETIIKPECESGARHIADVDCNRA